MAYYSKKKERIYFKETVLIYCLKCDSIYLEFNKLWPIDTLEGKPSYYSNDEYFMNRKNVQRFVQIMLGNDDSEAKTGLKTNITCD